MSSLTSKRCVVFGAGGFIGTNLCLRLISAAGEVRAFGRSKNFQPAFKDVEWIKGDFIDSDAVAKAIDGADVVFHLVNSTTPHSANQDKIADINANVLPTLQLLEACKSSGVSKVVYISSGGTVYGAPTRLPTPEDESCWPRTAYGISKLSIERYLNLYHYLYGLDYCILRVSNPYGPFQQANKNQGVVAAFLKKIMEMKPIEIWGDGETRRDYVYVEDVIDSLILAAESDDIRHKLFNIGSGVSVSLNELVSRLQLLVDHDIKVEYREARSVDIPNSVLDITRARETLDWRPCISLEDGLRKTISWFRSGTG